MATVRMRKGSKYADIFDSPEMIAGAMADGYELVPEEKKVEKVVPAEKEEKTYKEETTTEKQTKKTARQ